MTNNKKAAQLASTGTASKTAFNGDHCSASRVLSFQQSCVDDTQKPSRQNRRLKRTWKNRPKKQLTAAFMPWQSNCVAETTVTGLGLPSKAANKPQYDAAFFASGVPINGGPGGAAAMRAGALPVVQLRSVCHPYWTRDGGIKTATKATIMTKQKRTRAPSRFSVYNFIRKFTGPALAYRLSFVGRAA